MALKGILQDAFFFAFVRSGRLSKLLSPNSLRLSCQAGIRSLRSRFPASSLKTGILPFSMSFFLLNGFAVHLYSSLENPMKQASFYFLMN
jgi:hypothetical protein